MYIVDVLFRGMDMFMKLIKLVQEEDFKVYVDFVIKSLFILDCKLQMICEEI